MQEAHEKEIQVKKILIEGKNTLHDSVMFAWYRLVKIIMAKMILVIEESILKRIITDCDDV
jgi:hypothetical protein